jgi:hypothetical protein
VVTLREVAGDPEELVGLLDLLLCYPDDETLYIGLLLIDRRRQGQGIGTETGEVRPWRYDKLESESILMDKVSPVRGGGPGGTGGRGGGVR